MDPEKLIRMLLDREKSGVMDDLHRAQHDFKVDEMRGIGVIPSEQERKAAILARYQTRLDDIARAEAWLGDLRK